MFRFLVFMWVFSHGAYAEVKCLTEKDLYYKLVPSSVNGVKIINIYAKQRKEPLYSIESVDCSDCCELMTFVDIDFDSKKELLVQYDSDPTHSTNYSVLEIGCNRLHEHPIVPELGYYEINEAKKKLTSYFKDTNRWGLNKYCFENGDFFRCHNEIAVTNDIILPKRFDISGQVHYLGAMQNGVKVSFLVRSKAYLHKLPNHPTKMYIIKGDKVTLLEEQVDENGQRWYLINYKDKKDLNMWIKAEALDIESEPKPEPEEPCRNGKT